MWVLPPRTTQLKPPRTLPSPAGSLVVSLLGRIRLHVRRVSIVFAQPWRDRCGRARRWKARSSLSAHASSPRCRMGLDISRGGSRRASMPSARLVPTTGSEERGLLTRRVAQSCREPFQEHRVSLGWQNVFFLLQIKGGQRAKVNTVVTRAR